MAYSYYNGYYENYHLPSAQKPLRHANTYTTSRYYSSDQHNVPDNCKAEFCSAIYDGSGRRYGDTSNDHISKNHDYATRRHRDVSPVDPRYPQPRNKTYYDDHIVSPLEEDQSRSSYFKFMRDSKSAAGAQRSNGLRSVSGSERGGLGRTSTQRVRENLREMNVAGGDTSRDLRRMNEVRGRRPDRFQRAQTNFEPMRSNFSGGNFGGWNRF